MVRECCYTLRTRHRHVDKLKTGSRRNAALPEREFRVSEDTARYTNDVEVNLHWLQSILPHDVQIPTVGTSRGLHSRPQSQSSTLSQHTISMALNIACKRSAVRTLKLSPTRPFSTVVDDAFSPIAPTTAPPPPAAQRSTLEDAVNARRPRYDWTKDEIREIYQTPLMELAFHSVCRPESRYKSNA